VAPKAHGTEFTEHYSIAITAAGRITNQPAASASRQAERPHRQARLTNLPDSAACADQPHHAVVGLIAGRAVDATGKPTVSTRCSA
jgi:hypothetical protein